MRLAFGGICFFMRNFDCRACSTFLFFFPLPARVLPYHSSLGLAEAVHRLEGLWRHPSCWSVDLQ